MPSKPRIGKMRGLSGPANLHLLTGCCLVGCELCSRQRAFCPPGVEAYTLKPEGRRAWEKHRERLLALWRDPEGKPTGAGFSGGGYRGAGRWIPCFAEVFYDGASWPKRSASWPAVVRKIADAINDELKNSRRSDNV